MIPIENLVQHEIWQSVFKIDEVKTFLAGSAIVIDPPAPVTPISSTLKADASATLTNVVGTTAVLDGSKSTGAYTYSSWEVISGPGSTWKVFPGFKKGGVKLQVENLEPGQYVFEQTIGDNKAATNQHQG
jgi:hypothetical protein